LLNILFNVIAGFSVFKFAPDIDNESYLYAMALDGGGSTQLYHENGYLTESDDVTTTARAIPQGILVYKKTIPYLENHCPEETIPFNDGGGIYMHTWNNINLQNCKGKYDNSEFAVFDNSFLVKDGFWEKYKENSFGVNNLGNPKGNEIIIESDTCQAFEKGVLIWSNNTKVKTLIGEGINCSNYQEKHKKPKCFSDVTEYTNYSEKICEIKNKNLIDGYNNETFEPNNLINRAEFTKIIVTSIKDYNSYSVKNRNENLFDDVATDAWFSEFIYYAKDESIINGKEDGKFHPSDDINYAEASKIIVKALLINNNITSSTDDEWYKPFIEKLENKGISFSPYHKLTRGEMAYLIHSVCTSSKDHLCK